MLEGEGEALYPDSCPVIDSKEGFPEHSISELVELRDGVGLVGGNTAGKLLSLPRHCGHVVGCLSGGSTLCVWRPRFLVLVLLELSFVPETGSPLPMG